MEAGMGTESFAGKVETSFRIIERGRVACHPATTWNESQPHADPFTRLYFVDRGQGKVIYDGRAVLLRPGHYYLFPSDRPIQHTPSPGLGQYYLHFIAYVQGTLPLFDVVRWHPEQKVSDPAEARGRMEVLLAAPLSISDTLEQEAILRWIVAGFVREYRDTLQGQVDRVGRFGPVLEYMHQHLSSSISIGTLARLASLHPNYFSNSFTASLGVSPTEYMLRKRIERAQLLLWGTGDSIKEVASRVGYENTAYFCRLFKRRTGMTPSTYRAQRVGMLGS
jgi:AraC-like DNA-binding protein